MNPSEGARAMNRARWDKDPRTTTTCAICGAPMTTRRMYCSPACKQAAYRARAKGHGESSGASHGSVTP